MEQLEMLVHDLEGKPLALVGMLASQMLLGTGVPGDEVARKANEFLPPQERFNTVSQGVPYGHGNLVHAGAVQSALDELGVRDLWVAGPEEVMALLQTKKNLISFTSQDTGIMLYDTASGYVAALAERLRAAGFQLDLPAVVAGLGRPIGEEQSHFEPRLEISQRTRLYHAPALNGSFYAKRQQGFGELLLNGAKEGGDLLVVAHQDGSHGILHRRGRNLHVLPRHDYGSTCTNYILLCRKPDEAAK